jgi:fructose-1,6-bisphosphatase/inositol monophosphatase family enzyme
VTDPIAGAMQRAAAAAIVPRFRALDEADIFHKGVGDVVTTADRECESLLVDALATTAPGVPVLGEEAAASDPDATVTLLREPCLFVVDPLDGTRAFVNGSPDFAVMVARIDDGITTAAWIWQPMHQVLWTARRGGGAWRNGVRQLRPPVSGDAALLRGAVKTGHMDPGLRTTVTDRFGAFAAVTPGPASAGFGYPDLVTGRVDFTVFWRTLPWDHAPGALLAEEAGCHVRRLDGTPYRPGSGHDGLLSAAGPAAWEAARIALLG